MKKNFLTICSVLIATCLSSCASNNVHHEYNEYFLEVDYKTDFKILQLSDIHLSMKDDLDKHFKFMDLTIKDANPDLIVVTGDLFTFASKDTMHSLFNFLDSYSVPWTITYGNHDEQVYFSMEYMTTTLNSFSEYCKYIDHQDDDVYGSANFCINLKKDNKIKYQLYVLDSNRYYYGDYFGYDYIHQDQIDWYEGMVNYSKENNDGTTIPSLAFFHIPFEEYKTAYELYESDSSEVEHIFGDNGESVSSPKYNSGLFDKMVELGSTKGTFVGHDHNNNSEIVYKGIHLTYGLHSTDRIYGDLDRLGGLLITIHEDDSFSTERIFHTYDEVK